MSRRTFSPWRHGILANGSTRFYGSDRIRAYARRFNGTTDKVRMHPAGIATATNIIPGTTGSGQRRSHPVPFKLANGNILLSYCTNEYGATFSLAVATSTDGGLTFGTAQEVGGSGVGVDNTYEGAFAQLSGGTVVFVYGEGAVVKYKTSSDNGATWSSASTIVTGTGDPHPSVCLDGSTLIVAYTASNQVLVRRATVTSTTVGAFGGAITVNSAVGSIDPSIVCTSAGNLCIAYATDGASGFAKVKRSTDSGATWGSEITVNDGMDSTTTTDPNLVAFSGKLVLLQALGTAHSGSTPPITPGTRWTIAYASADAGATWSSRRVFFNDATYDLHRVNACVNAAGELIAYGAGIKNDTDFHIDRFNIDQTLATTLSNAGQTTPVDNMTVWTAFAWLYYAGTPNASQNMMPLTKGGRIATQINRAFMQFRDDGTYTNGLLGFVERATTNSQYAFNNALSDSTWTFCAINFDDARGTGARFRIWTGTTPANLTQRTVTVVTEGSGTPTDDSGQDVTVGSRSSDDARGFPGDIGGLVGLVPDTLTLAQLQQIMSGVIPNGVTPAFLTDMSTLVPDLSARPAAAQITGTTTSPSNPPEV